MARTTLGRHIYAIGGNRLAARLSGIRVNRVLMIVYIISGAMAGIGGVMLASQFQSGVANYGRMYELYAIAAVVVGGTSLAGGEGKILGTLIGVFIIAVIQNAMNLLELGSYVQMVVLGLIVLAVVLLDTLKRQGWRGLLTPE
jgi:ribose transport system permease protein